MRAVRAALPPLALAARSAKVCAQLGALPEMSAAHRVALFWPMVDRAEVDLRSLHGALIARGAAVYYPFQREDGSPEIGFAELPEGHVMEGGPYGYAEPPPSAPAAPRGALEIIVCPALAVAATGHRLGYGSAYYDRVLPEHSPPAVKVVVAYDFQLLAELPVEEGDVACDIVVTDERVLRV